MPRHKFLSRLRRAFLSVTVLQATLHILPAQAEAPPERMATLARGINISHWLRFPPDNHPKAMQADLDDAAIASLQHVGFTYVRLPVGMEEVMQGNHIAPEKLEAIINIVSRIEQAGLAVMIQPYPQTPGFWDQDHRSASRSSLTEFWQDLAPALKRFSARMTFPELVNEPLAQDSSDWDAIQRQLVSLIRASLPESTIILTGTNWSSIDGLLKVQPVSDINVVYSFHTYEPQLFTLLGFWDPKVNQTQLAQHIPFPANNDAHCLATIAAIDDPHTRQVAAYWCSLHQDKASIAANLDRATQWGRQHGVSVAMTEFGATDKINPSSRAAYLKAVVESAFALKLPWALWALDDQMAFNIPALKYKSAAQLSPLVMQAAGLVRAGH